MPSPAENEVLIQVKASSICGSDVLRVYAGHAKTYPLILGHEFSGIITAVGDGADAGWLGQKVAVAPLIPCMKCESCRQGLYSACKAYSFIGSRRAGAYAEYCAVPVSCLVPMPEGLDFEVGAVLEPATVALHAIERGGMSSGKSVAVLGVGSVGQYAVQWARVLGASVVVATDTAEANLVMARREGAAYAFNPQHDDVVARIIEATSGGPDLVLEAVGHPDTLMQAVAMVRARGTIVCVGNLPHDAMLPAELIEQIMRKELHLCGTWMSYSAPFPGHEWGDTLAAVKRGELHVQAMITHRIQLDDVPGILPRINEHAFEHGKIVILP